MWTRVELCMFTTRDVSPLVLKPFISQIEDCLMRNQYTKVKGIVYPKICHHLLLQYGVTPVSQISLEKPEAVQTSVFWVTATRAERVAVALDLVWAVMVNLAKVSDITANQLLQSVLYLLHLNYVS